MRNTIVLQVNEPIAAFIAQGNTDPSAVINMVLRNRMAHMMAEGSYRPGSAKRLNNTEMVRELEAYADETIPAAG